MSKRLKDKLILISIGFSIVVFGFFIYFGLRKNLPIEWADFTIASIAYLVLMLGGALTFEEFKKVPKHKLLLFWGIFYVLTVSIAYSMFRYKLLPMPKSFHVYTAGIVILLIIGTVVFLEYIIKKFKFFQDKNKTGKRV